MFANKFKMVRNPHINANDQKSNGNNGFSSFSRGVFHVVEVELVGHERHALMMILERRVGIISRPALSSANSSSFFESMRPSLYGTSMPCASSAVVRIPTGFLRRSAMRHGHAE